MGDELKKDLGREYLKELDRIAFEVRKRVQELKLPEQSNLFNFYNGQLCMIRTAKTKFKHIFKKEKARWKK